MSAAQLTVGRLNVLTHSNRLTMGAAAAEQVAGAIQEVTKLKGRARIIFACAPS